ncbi:aminoglycoside phosphotransferase family protein [Aspergillus lucknowensis]|uniref:Kinase-like domain-containing protein n=1 Tax=Aspergillus lucknowensis TaxID=176173 RepID=A0ABR4M551_9EURO
MPTTFQAEASRLPQATATEMDFRAEVTARSKDFKSTPQPAPVKFDNLNLIVKFGPHVVVEEALCLRILQKTLADTVPVPEVYGWRVEGAYACIYMELIQGESLYNRWDYLGDRGRASICHQLRDIVSSLREVEQDPTDPFIGSITRQSLLDYVFQGMPPGGPFKSIKDFNDWCSSLPQNWLPDSRKYADLYRPFLPDTGTIKLTHGDLHQGNIMISSTSPPRILAVIDWAHAGWYPDYWEYCKSLYTAKYDGEWRNIWISKFLSPHTAEFGVFAEYIMQVGAV